MSNIKYITKGPLPPRHGRDLDGHVPLGPGPGVPGLLLIKQFFDHFVSGYFQMRCNFIQDGGKCSNSEKTVQGNGYVVCSISLSRQTQMTSYLTCGPITEI